MAVKFHVGDWVKTIDGKYTGKIIEEIGPGYGVYKISLINEEGIENHLLVRGRKDIVLLETKMIFRERIKLPPTATFTIEELEGLVECC